MRVVSECMCVECVVCDVWGGLMQRSVCSDEFLPWNEFTSPDSVNDATKKQKSPPAVITVVWEKRTRVRAGRQEEARSRLTDLWSRDCESREKKPFLGNLSYTRYGLRRTLEKKKKKEKEIHLLSLPSVSGEGSTHWFLMSLISSRIIFPFIPFIWTKIQPLSGLNLSTKERS